MSSPGGPNNWNWNSGDWNSGDWNSYSGDSGQQYDPLTGQPVDANRMGYSGPAQPGQPHGNQSSYQGFGLFEPDRNQPPQQPHQPPPSQGPEAYQHVSSGSGKGPIVAAISVGAVVLVGIFTVIIVLGGGESDNNAKPLAPSSEPAFPSAPETSTVETSAATSTAEPESTASKTENVRYPVKPVVDGWQGMKLPEFGVAYDIPQNWKPNTGSLSGFENDTGERVALSGYSSYKEDFCAEEEVSFRARVGISSSEKDDPTTAAKHAIRKWARLGFRSESGAKPTIKMNPVKAVSLDNGELSGKQVTATITPAVPGECATPKTYISVIALASDNGAALLIGLADQGVQGAVSPKTINKILTSVRLLED